MGIPLICNSGVCDVQQQMEQLGAGYCMQGFEPEEMAKARQAIPSLLRLNPKALRDKARPLLDLSLARERYARVYRQLT